MALVLDWQKKLGYSRNPFEGRSSLKQLVGLHLAQERLNLFLIKEERFGTISGEPGTGKTALLEWMNSELAPQKSHLQHLIDAKEHKREHIVTSLLQAHLSFFERKFGSVLKASLPEKEKLLLARLSQEKRNILLIDDAGSLGAHELELLTDLVLKTPTHVILADTKERLKKLSLPEPLIDTLKLQTPDYTTEQLTEILHNRITAAGGRGTHPFDEFETAGLIKRSGHNPAKLLQLAQERAIELSLKLSHHDAPPAGAAAPAPAPPGKFFSIKIEKVKPGHHKHESSAPAQSADAAEPAAAEPKNTVPQEPAPENADLSALAQEVDPSLAVPATPKRSKHAAATRGAHDESISHDLIEEVIAKIPAPAKTTKPATKKGAKAAKTPAKAVKKTTAHRR